MLKGCCLACHRRLLVVSLEDVVFHVKHETRGTHVRFCCPPCNPLGFSPNDPNRAPEACMVVIILALAAAMIV